MGDVDGAGERHGRALEHEARVLNVHSRELQIASITSRSCVGPSPTESLSSSSQGRLRSHERAPQLRPISAFAIIVALGKDPVIPDIM